MRNILLLTVLFVSTALSAQFSLQLEQGITISDDINYKPFGIAFNYRLAAWKGNNVSLGLAFDQVTLEEDLRVNPEVVLCGVVGCFPNDSWVKSYESRLMLVLGLNSTVNRFTYGFQIRPGFRVRNDIRIPDPYNLYVVSTKFGEYFPKSTSMIELLEYQVNKEKFSLQIGTDCQYALTDRISVGLNYRYEGIVNNDIIFLRIERPTNGTAEFEYFRGEARVHYLVATVGWRW